MNLDDPPPLLFCLRFSETCLSNLSNASLPGADRGTDHHWRNDDNHYHALAIFSLGETRLWEQVHRYCAIDNTSIPLSLTAVIARLYGGKYVYAHH